MGMNYNGSLGEKMREVIKSGKLPDRRPDRTWAGPGVGADCTICGAPVTHEEMEFRIEFVKDGDAPGTDKYHVHIRCFAAWEIERRQVELGKPILLHQRA
jgi:hypothetical protein